MKNFFSNLKKGCIEENPVLVFMLGLCPLLAASETLFSGMTMGAAVIITLVLSGIVISLIRKIIPENIKIIVYMLIIACFVTAIELLLQAFLPPMAEKLGIYLPLLTVSGFTLAKAECVAGRKKVGTAVVDAVITGISFFAVIFVLSFVRELLGCGTLFGLRILPAEYCIQTVGMPVGAFMLLGVLLAMFGKITSRKVGKEEKR